MASVGNATMVLTNRRHTTEMLYSSLYRGNFGTILDSDIRLRSNVVCIAAKNLSSKFRIPDRGFVLVARQCVTSSQVGLGEGTGGNQRVNSLSRLGGNSCIIRITRNVNVFSNVGHVAGDNIAGSCVGVECTGDSILCMPMARLSLISQCVNTTARSNGVGVGHLNNDR